MPAPDLHTQLTGVILAGGRGRRMDGEDKGLLLLHGRPLVAHVSERLRPQVGRLLVVANRNTELYAPYADAVYADIVPDFQGPLAGMATALSYASPEPAYAIEPTHASTELVLCVPCDVPELPTDLAARLLRALLDSDLDACAVHDGVDKHPVICLLRTHLKDDLLAALREERRRVRDWLCSQRFAWVDFSDQAGAFANFNRPEMLRGR